MSRDRRGVTVLDLPAKQTGDAEPHRHDLVEALGLRTG